MSDKVLDRKSSVEWKKFALCQFPLYIIQPSFDPSSTVVQDWAPQGSRVVFFWDRGILKTYLFIEPCMLYFETATKWA